MENFTIHIFGYGETQINSKDLSVKVSTDTLTTVTPLLTGVFAKKPAKIQVSWAGYLMSTGLKQMDYIIVDPYVVKQTDQNYFSEKFIFLNDIWCCYSNTSFLNIKVKKDLPLAANKFITFGSFNNLLKLCHPA